MIMNSLLMGLVILLTTGPGAADNQGPLLDESLLKEDPAVLAKAVHEQGDAAERRSRLLSAVTDLYEVPRGRRQPDGDTIGPDLSSWAVRRPTPT